MKNELKRKHTQVESNIQDFAMNKTPKKYSTPEKTKVKEITPEKKTV